MRISLETHGCRLNRADHDSLCSTLAAGGHEVVARVEDADVHVLNSCTITHEADADARAAVRRARRRNPQVKVAVTGCYANAAPDEAAALPGVSWVVGNEGKGALPQILGGAELVRAENLLRKVPTLDLPSVEPGDRTRALLKCQDGCDYRCTFCIVPSVRGNSRSHDAATLTQRFRDLVAAGVPEVVLTGVHLGTWGRDLPGRPGLRDLVATLLADLHVTGAPARLRLSSVDPHEVTPELIELMATQESFCRHLHLPVQSADPGVLRRMRRMHSARALPEVAARAVAAVPDICIGTDVITGFPGESGEAFERTLEALRELPLSYMHVFSYSRRRGTPAADYDGQIPREVIRERTRRLRELDRDKRAAFRASMVGKVLPAVIYRRSDAAPERHRGLTDNYLELDVQGAPQRRAWTRVLVRPGATEAAVVA